MGARGVSVFEFGIFFARSQIDRDDATPGGKNITKNISKFFCWFSWHEDAVAPATESTMFSLMVATIYTTGLRRFVWI